MYDFEKFSFIFNDFSKYDIGETFKVDDDEVIIIGKYNEGYDSDGEYKVLLITSINGETYAATRWDSSYDSYIETYLKPVTKKTKTIEYWE
jgi:hypothetical protein